MTWFKVDDKLHSNNKIRKVLADEPAALALWLVAGSWSSDNLTDGLIPDHQLPWLMPAGAEQLAQKLVAARLWRRVRGGYQFHQWLADGDGTKRNPSRAEVEAERQKKAEAGRKGGLASGRRRANQNKVHVVEGPTSDPRRSFDDMSKHPTNDAQQTDITSSDQHLNGSKTEARASANASAGARRIVEPPTRPDPLPLQGREGRGSAAGISSPGQCRRHQGQPEHNCGPCKSERLGGLDD